MTICTSMTSLPPKPKLYNRPWHLDLDDRRHHGHRQWDRAVLERLIDLISRFDFLYPPDWSDLNSIRFRASGVSDNFAEIRTDDPHAVVLILWPKGKSSPITVSSAADLSIGFERRLAVSAADFRSRLTAAK